ncbi:hypothetical protein CTAYLR_001966 [Chrysophaeum taylorii]|uniref:RCC1-like domain-containing protein n=1 Tax=Chrysophaeum taylorii TaxID=2483200 RepID=A0AAD7UAT9_9STRA|nr:hypothetical protein CTAYLR_001966 [Chrysophaeum taylorii]
MASTTGYRPRFSVKQARLKLLKAAEKLERDELFPPQEQQQQEQVLLGSASAGSILSHHNHHHHHRKPRRVASPVPAAQKASEEQRATLLFSCGVHDVASDEVREGEEKRNRLRPWLEPVEGPGGSVGDGDFIVGVACAESATVAVTANGKVVGWGGGTLMRGTGSRPARPETVQSVLGSTRCARLVACGPRHAVVVTSDGKLLSWGAGGAGRLGHGDAAARHAPTLVDALASGFVVAAACGGEHTAAIVARERGDVVGRLYTWGDARAGQLGHVDDDDDDEGDDSSRPRPVAFFDRQVGVRLVACGLHHTLAVSWEELDGKLCAKLYAWGFGDEGRLGVGDETTCRSPTRVLLPVEYGSSKPAYVSSTSAGDKHSLALLSDGRLFAWGDNSFGQLGLGKATKTAVAFPTQVPTPSGEDLVHVACGARHSGATTARGEVLLWGFGEEGQLGGGPELTCKSAPQGETAAAIARPVAREATSTASDPDDPTSPSKRTMLAVRDLLGSSSIEPAASPKRRWAADSVALGVRHTVVLCRNAKAGVTRAALADSAFGGGDDPTPDVPLETHPVTPPEILEPVTNPPEVRQSPEVEDGPVVQNEIKRFDRALLEERLMETRERRRRARDDRHLAEVEGSRRTAESQLVAPAARPKDDKTGSVQQPAPAPSPPRAEETPVIADDPQPAYQEEEEEQPIRRPYSDIFYRDSQDVDVCFVANAARRARSRERRKRSGAPDNISPYSAPKNRSRRLPRKSPSTPQLITEQRRAQFRRPRNTIYSCASPPRRTVVERQAPAAAPRVKDDDDPVAAFMRRAAAKQYKS